MSSHKLLVEGKISISGRGDFKMLELSGRSPLYVTDTLPSLQLRKNVRVLHRVRINFSNRAGIIYCIINYAKRIYSVEFIILY